MILAAPAIRRRRPAARRLRACQPSISGCRSLPETLAPRRKSRQIKVGKVLVGGDAQVSVQSMCTTPTTNINATLQQIAELTASGCDIVRVAVPSQDDADVLHIIAKKSQIPVIADIHFQPKYVFQAIDAGCAGGPGEPRQHPQVRRPGRRDRQGGQGCRHQHPDRRQRRIARALDHAEVRQGDARGARRERRLGGVALRGARLPRLQDLGQAQRPDRDGARPTACSPSRATGRCTSASPRPAPRSRAPSRARRRSASCSSEGIGDTIRVSLSAPPAAGGQGRACRSCSR